MGAIAASHQLGMLSTPVVFEVDEGPEPGPIADVVRQDSPAPAEVGIAPMKLLLTAGAMIIGGYLVLRKLLD